MRHELKTDPGIFTAVAKGSKTFELRKNDRDFKVGDELLLKQTRYSAEEMNKAYQGKPLEYTGAFWTVKVRYILHGPALGLKKGWCIMSVKEMSV